MDDHGIFKVTDQDVDFLGSVADENSVVVVVTDTSGQIVFVNRTFTAVTGFQREEAVGRTPAILKSGKTPREQYDHLWNDLKSGNAWSGSFLNRKKDGGLYRCREWIAPLRRMDGAATHYVALARDITDQGDEDFGDRHRPLRAILDASLDAVVTIDSEGRLTEFNRAAEIMFGRSRAAVLGQYMADLMIPSSLRERHRHAVSRYLQTGKRTIMGQRVELTALRANGSEFPIELTVTPLPTEEGMPTFTGFVRDLTEQKRAERALQEKEEQLVQMQKMDSLGQMAGSIAHDFNNLLTAILGFSQFVVDRMEDGHPLKADVKEILHSARRGSEMTKHLLAFARHQVMKLHPVAVNKVLRDMEYLVRSTLGETVDLLMLLSDHDDVVMADDGPLEQIVMNLVVNARDAMPSGGMLFITTDTRDVPGLGEATFSDVPAGEYVVLSIRDTGCGMPDEVRKRLFEPFFTTKEKGHGTGLGLATVYGIVKQCKAYIDVVSTVGSGTEFLIAFPRANGAPDMKPTTAIDAPPRGTERILVVEDDQHVRRYALRMLESLGYTVTLARDGEEALELFRASPHDIDLILTDVKMPRMCGPDFVRRVHDLGYDPRFLYMTGYAGELLESENARAAGSRILAKPFTIQALAREVRHALDAPDPDDYGT